MFEETAEMLAEFFHVLFEVLHNLFEIMEMGVDNVVERLFHFLHVGEFFAYLFITERHASQVFTFYILISMIGYLLYKLSKHVPRLYEFLKQMVLFAWIRRKTQCQLFWRSLTRLYKVLFVTSVLGAVILASFFVI
ncbi:MAG: hypothetical protein ABSB19_13385 [Methylomonas sp.]